MRAKAARILRIVSHERSPDRTRIKFQLENVSIEGRIEVPVRCKCRSPARYLSALHPPVRSTFRSRWGLSFGLLTAGFRAERSASVNERACIVPIGCGTNQERNQDCIGPIRCGASHERNCRAPESHCRVFVPFVGALHRRPAPRMRRKSRPSFQN